MTTGPNPVLPPPTTPPPPKTLIGRVAALEDALTEFIRRYNSFMEDVSKELGL